VYKGYMETKILSINDPSALAQAIDILTSGGLVAFPTDTVYGLGALVFDEDAIGSIDEIRSAHDDEKLPILIADFDQLDRIVMGMSNLCEKLARRFWPGPLTLMLPRHASISDAVTPYPTVGVRIPDFEPSRDLLRLTGPLAVSTANYGTQTIPRSAQEVKEQLGGKIALILDGGVTPGGIPSTVVDCTQGQPIILREGPITMEQVLNALV
jgi:L-threonylcarbamoyladenylate synthase